MLPGRGIPIGGPSVGVDKGDFGFRKQIIKGRNRLGGAKRDRDGQHFVTRNQLAGGGHGALRIVRVVLYDNAELAALDATPVVDHTQVRLNAGTMRHAVGRNRPG